MEAALRSEYQTALAADTWRKKFRGRDVLRRLADRVGGPVKYEILRNLIIARMRDAGFQPDGMREVVLKILASD
jgi:hypothetical protein